MMDFAATPAAVAAYLDHLPATPKGIYLRPAGLVSGIEGRAAVGMARAKFLAGGDLAFTLCEIILRGRHSILTSVEDLLDWCDGAGGVLAAEVGERLSLLTRPRADFAGLPVVAGSIHQTILMGIVNVTPDSFSDGGESFAAEDAINKANTLRQDGAAILDIGGESTRPGATPVPPAEEQRRVLPVIAKVASQGATVSIDTRNAEVMEAAMAKGAQIINDVSALSGDPRSVSVAAKTGAFVVLMHMQGVPATMQDNPRYDDAALDVFDALDARVRACEEAGIPRSRIVVDPGIGFGKTKQHNAEILSRIGLYHGLGCGIMIGVSRKSFVAGAGGGALTDNRLPGSLAAALAAVSEGCQILRVHDVAETRQALAVWDAVHGPLG